jgi:hypothetical protein
MRVRAATCGVGPLTATVYCMGVEKAWRKRGESADRVGNLPEAWYNWQSEYPIPICRRTMDEWVLTADGHEALCYDVLM